MALLGERIAQSIFNTAPEPDPENEFDDDTIAHNEAVDTGVDVEINPSRLRDIDLGDTYEGKVVSRKELNEWSDDNDNDIDIDINSDNNDSDLSEHNSEPLRVIPVFESDENSQEEEFDTLFEDYNTNNAGLPNMDKSEKTKTNNNNKSDFTAFSSMMNSEMDKAIELQSKEQIIMDKTHIKPHSFQLKKAKAVAAQTRLYDKVATLRIHLQKPFQISQKLPRPSVHCELSKKRELNELFTHVSEEALGLCQNIMDLQSKLLAQNEEYPLGLRQRKRRRLNSESWNDLWTEQNKDWSDIIPFCNKTMDIWDRKMRLVESYASKKKGKGKDNQSLLERMALIIDNPHRILYKMQSVDKLFRMYGDSDRSESKEREMGMNDNGNGANGLKFEKYRMECEVFNDSQFYRRMLKEIIDIGHAASFNADEIHKKMDQIQFEKQKQKMAFHKAKLRMKYTIRPDMENFMAPIYDHDPDFHAEQLYNSLFQ